MPRTVAIIGAAGCAWLDHPPVGAERWLINDGWKRQRDGFHFDDWDRAFDLHPWADIQRRRRNHVDWLQKQTGTRPVYLIEPQPTVPNAVAYPRAAVQAHFAHPTGELEECFTSSLDWTIALALMEGVSRIELYGVDMYASAERADRGPVRRSQREGAFYWIGGARRMGVEVVTQEGSSICRVERLYGFGEFTGSANFVSMDLRRFADQLRMADEMEAYGEQQHT